MINAILPKRGTDDFGSGDFEASRDGGKRKHKGIDYACYPETMIQAKYSGEITKFGYPYSDDLSYRYIEITDRHGSKHRYFYVEPDKLLKVGDDVEKNDVIGLSQDISGRYTNKKHQMKNHIHYEILVDGEPVNTELYNA